MTIIDLTDPVAMQDAIENGYVWSAPAGAQEKACQLIAGGKVPMPGYLPRYAKARIAELGKDPNSIGFVANDGEGPA